MTEKRKLDKFAFFLPNTFTALNMACGFGAIMYSMKHEFYVACMFLLLGAIFDSVDGRVARLTGTQSSFGEQFDSLSDLISFGMAPAIIFYNRFLMDLGRVGIVVAFLYLLCGALRLARFNANIDRVKSDYFQGLPIPGAATGIVGFVLIALDFNQILDHTYITVPYIVFYSLLMVSNFPFPSFKNSTWVRSHRKQALLALFLLIAGLFIYEKITIPAIITSYVIGSFVYALFHKKELAGIFDWKDEHEDE